ncbi:MAG: 8-oxo-dGTP diphosphatase [Clostridia bacterium]|nr:8-oxo-dGTP diphosphatase [Clostridia bacterium]
MSNAEKVILTNMCMIYDEKGNVVVQDRQNPDWPGVVFPGGHVEYGESFTDSVIREIYEETGLVISNLQICGIKDWMRDDGSRYVVVLYKTNTFNGELTSSDEGKVWWVPIDELQKMNLPRSMHSMLKIFMEDGVIEQYLYKDNGEWFEVLK